MKLINPPQNYITMPASCVDMARKNLSSAKPVSGAWRVKVNLKRKKEGRKMNKPKAWFLAFIFVATIALLSSDGPWWPIGQLAGIVLWIAWSVAIIRWIKEG